MATQHARFVRNLYGAAEPLIMLGKFVAGASQAIKMGELLELTGSSNTTWVPMDSDFAGSGNVAIAACDVKSGDLAGYYPIIVPRPGDVFEYPLATASAIAVGAAVYYSSSEAVAASGTNALGYCCGQEHYPLEQGHLSEGDVGDRGTTIRSTAYARFIFKHAASYYAALSVP